MVLRDIKKLIRKIVLSIFAISLIVICFSCSQTVEKTESTAEVIETERKEETTVVETKTAFVPESIDISDVSGDQYRNALIKIDELNHILGEAIYVTKEDYLKYKDVKVSLIGDSIAEFSKTHLNRCFRNLVQDSVPGREMVVGIEAFDAMKEIGRIGDIMILSLGNNAMRGIEVDVLEHVYNGIEGRPLIIPTIVMPYAGQERNRNRDLINFVNTHENCYIADWNKIARMGEDFITEDGVHPTGEGSAAYAQLMLKTVIDIAKMKQK
ncbi:MAG: hypothetical protein IKI71_00180 [Lachnospiraceae bacterium]|nr:hypothetical protein [Lachnospiraceae bacterium]